MRPILDAREVTIDGRAVPSHLIQAEMQYHPAEDAGAAWREAAMALVLKIVVHRRALSIGLAPDGDPLVAGFPTDWIDALIAAEVALPEADEEECRRFHASHPSLFLEPMQAEAQHILLPAAADDPAARASAKAQAATLIAEIAADPARFEPLAGKYSACPSAPLGGHLGKVARGSAIEEFETYLFNLDEGQLCPVPIETRYGVHVLRVLKRYPAHPLPYERAKQMVADELDALKWRQAVKSYLDRLVGAARISGLDRD